MARIFAQSCHIHLSSSVQTRNGQKGCAMKPLMISTLVASFALAACAQQPQATRAMFLQGDLANAGSPVVFAAETVLQGQYDVQAVNVSVPQSLTTSEANSFHPNVAIVWRGDAPGERHAQVKAIFEQAFARSAATMHQGPKVVVDIEVTRFHCLTEKARFTVGGVHNMRFLMTVRDAASGTVLQGPRLINADIRAAGGAHAIAEDAEGRTQKVVVTERLAEVIRRELSAPVQSLPQNAAVTRFDGSPVQLSARD
jgi:hypothetical protein